ncbi:MAG: hypothetical protein A3D74_03080 [Candidatus Levybacteria bacterium RIFCSPHIGHO2_02_FULL_37_13]|nr:MAG: hypothetical protein A3D74_03080 [Candidatus Levybacteria bacterium RIFCSPHIGHO2_02_FULL_37_13]OGH37761.1 MAG: hypothetical protein A3B41_02500 [Candidatus Levybacteria bacterium RIFCSPLOWO2_01_FULL_37_26]
MFKAINTKILLSGATVLAAAALIIGGTFAFFSDTETSTGNTFAAGSIDLKVSNESYLLVDGEMEPQPDLSWEAGDLDDQLFFDYEDLKPGDLGEDTIDLVIEDNDAWTCMDVELTATPENGQTEPEAVVDTTVGSDEGELQDEINFVWWVDDGDNVLEDDEVDSVFNSGSLADMDGFSVAIADSTEESLTGGKPITGGEEFFIGKAWCFGDLTADESTALPDLDVDGEEDNRTPDERGAGVTCEGSEVGNESQTDGVVGNVSFYAEQSRNNDDFECEVPEE